MQRGANGQRVGVSVRAAVRGRSQLSRRREWHAGAWDMLILSGCCDMDVSLPRALPACNVFVNDRGNCSLSGGLVVRHSNVEDDTHRYCVVASTNANEHLHNTPVMNGTHASNCSIQKRGRRSQFLQGKKTPCPRLLELCLR